MALKNKKSQFAEWYPEVVQEAGLADYSSVGGCMVIKPLAYSIWEKIQQHFDKIIKDTGHKNAYFPLFVPESLLKKEEQHFEGFQAEVAWIERKDEKEERVALRPTSETIIYDSFSKWIRSWRDLPLLINQWCNVVRWETKVTRLFLRTREFLWQEGHTAHISKEDADKEVLFILNEYKKLMEELLAIPVLIGKKSEGEKFPGALYTTTLEALMPDGRALQMGTSHNLGQHFAKVFDIKFLDKSEKESFVWQTSWGISTRLIGALAMVHGDDKGLILPPSVASVQVVIVPILFEDSKKQVLKKAAEVKASLEKLCITSHLDDRTECTPGWKYNEWELKGVPLRIEIGPKDLEKDQLVLVRRDTGEKAAVKNLKAVKTTLDKIQEDLFQKAKKFLESNIADVKAKSEFEKAIKEKKFARGWWCHTESCEKQIKEDTTATVRVITFEQPKKKEKCFYCGKEGKDFVYVAKAY